MGLFEISDETIAEYTVRFRELAQERVDEPVLAMGPFRHGGAAAGMAISRARLGALAYVANSLFHKQRAAGLPERVFLVVTPRKVHGFKWSQRGSNYRLKDEVAVWPREGLRISTEPKLGLTMLTLESPADGSRVTLAPGGIKDDPWTQEVIRVLRDGVTEAPQAA